MQLAHHAKLAADYVNQQIRQLRAQGQDSAAKASLARLRRGIGKAPGSIPELWEVTLKGLPEELLSRDGAPTKGEWAVHTALTLYSLHQQGRDLQNDSMQQSDALGTAVGRLVKRADEDLPRVKRRFDAAATADSLPEFSHHLRGLVQLLKAEGIGMDYANLAEDLVWFQLPESRDKVRLRWGQDFYRQVGKLQSEPQPDDKTQKEEN